MWLSVVVILGRTKFTADTFCDSFYGAATGITVIEWCLSGAVLEPVDAMGAVIMILIQVKRGFVFILN